MKKIKGMWTLILLIVVLGFALSFCSEGGDDDSVDDDSSDDDAGEQCDKDCFWNFMDSIIGCFDATWDCLEGGEELEQCFGNLDTCASGVQNDMCECVESCNSCGKEYCNCSKNCPEDDRECLTQCDDEFDECAEWYDGECINACFDIGGCINDCVSDGVYDDCRQCTEGLEDCVENCF